MFFTPRLHLLAVALLPALLGGCVAPPPPKPTLSKTATAAAATPKPSYWNGTGAKGSPRIVIALGEQRAYFYRGKKLVGESIISTGKNGFETPPGDYQVIQKNKDHVSNLYGDFVDDDGSVVRRNVDVSKDKPPEGAQFRGAKMPYFMRFRGGYGLHAGRVPAYRASHGCVRLPREMAIHFYNNAQIGTPVIVEGR
jgi:lipoprotein-anchoring transpeptidase ErfK/SrfK